MNEQEKTAIVLILIIVAIISFVTGMYYGINKTTEYGLNMLWALMDREKINVDIDRQMIEKAWFQYESNIAGCLFLENATG